MKSKKEPKVRWGLWVISCLFILFYDGCGDTQSNQVVYVTGYSVNLFHNPDEPVKKRPDRWAVSNDAEGKDICGVAQMSKVEIKNSVS